MDPLVLLVLKAPLVLLDPLVPLDRPEKMAKPVRLVQSDLPVPLALWVPQVRLVNRDHKDFEVTKVPEENQVFLVRTDFRVEMASMELEEIEDPQVPLDQVVHLELTVYQAPKVNAVNLAKPGLLVLPEIAESLVSQVYLVPLVLEENRVLVVP